MQRRYVYKGTCQSPLSDSHDISTRTSEHHVTFLAKKKELSHEILKLDLSSYPRSGTRSGTRYISFISALWMFFPESWKRSCPNFYAHDCTVQCYSYFYTPQ